MARILAAHLWFVLPFFVAPASFLTLPYVRVQPQPTVLRRRRVDRYEADNMYGHTYACTQLWILFRVSRSLLWKPMRGSSHMQGTITCPITLTYLRDGSVPMQQEMGQTPAPMPRRSANTTSCSSVVSKSNPFDTLQFVVGMYNKRFCSANHATDRPVRDISSLPLRLIYSSWMVLLNTRALSTSRNNTGTESSRTAAWTPDDRSHDGRV